MGTNSHYYSLRLRGACIASHRIASKRKLGVLLLNQVGGWWTDRLIESVHIQYDTWAINHVDEYGTEIG